jgi:hypothetical protein
MIRPTLVIAIGLVGACQTSESRYTVDDYWNELGTAHCQTMLDCCTQAEYNDWWTTSDGDVVSCEKTHKAPPTAGSITDAIAKRRIIFDEARAHACVEALQSLACPMFEQAYRYRETYCEPPLIGTVATGDHCVVNEECVGSFCRSGTCAELVAKDHPCTVGVDACADGTRCTSPDGQNQFTCNFGRPAGASCVSDDQCIDSWCKSDSFSSGTCLRACKGK